MKFENVTIQLSPAQAELFRNASAYHSIDPGKIILALACDRLTSNVAEELEDVATALRDLVRMHGLQGLVPASIDAEWVGFVETEEFPSAV